MVTDSVSARSFLLMTALSLFGARALTVAQTPGIPQAALPASGYRIAGTIVSKTDGHPLARARVTVRDAKAPRKFESVVTSEDGKFEFTGVPAGKYDLNGAKRGFISASYDQHEQFSTAIVTGAGLETEALVLRLAPKEIISGKILDESVEPVRHATVSAYYDDHSSGVDQIRNYRGTRTDDQGAYEIAGLMPGTYFLSASATPIPIRGGGRLQVEIHLNPVPSLRLLFRVPNNGNNGFPFPQLEQPVFDGSAFLQSDGVRVVSPGVVELTGIPAGHYNVRLQGAGPALQMSGVDLSKDGQEIDTTSGEALSTIKVSVQEPGETTLP